MYISVYYYTRFIDISIYEDMIIYFISKNIKNNKIYKKNKMAAARNTKPETRNPDKNETFSLNTYITRTLALGLYYVHVHHKILYLILFLTV
jgi:hypothetical protein